MKPHVVNDTLTEQQALELAATEWWKAKTPQEIVAFQLFTKRLCMPFSEFQEATEKVLKRGVYTHEFANPDRLREEFRGERLAPTLGEILALIPNEKLLVVTAEATKAPTRQEETTVQA